MPAEHPGQPSSSVRSSSASPGHTPHRGTLLPNLASDSARKSSNHSRSIARTARRLCGRSSRKRSSLIARLMFLAFQEDPLAFVRSGCRPLADRADFGTPNLIDRIAHVLGDMKPVDDVEGVPGLLGDDLEIRLPHVAANEREFRGPLLVQPAEEPERRLDAPVRAEPQEPLPRRVDLVDERQEVAAVLPVDFIDCRSREFR